MEKINFTKTLNMDSRIIQVGPCPMKWVENDHENSNLNPKNPCLKPLKDSSSLLNHKDSRKLLLEKFENDGYLFIRGLLDRDTVFRAKNFVLQDMEKRGGILDPSRDIFSLR